MSMAGFQICLTHSFGYFATGGDVNIDDSDFSVRRFTHSLMVFGGVAGIEECIDADETSKLPGSESKNLFDLWYAMLS
jgi:Putative RNA methyltransferase